MLVAVMSAVAWAQDPQRQDNYDWVDAAVKRVTDRLSLTEGEIQKVAERIKAYFAEIKKARDEAEKAVQELLGEDNYAKSRAEVQRILAGFGNAPRGGQSGSVGGSTTRLIERIDKDLGLGEEDLKKVHAVIDESSQKIRTLFSDLRNAGGNNRDAFRQMGEKVQAEREAMIGKIKELLNDDQKKKLEDIWKDVSQQANGGFGGRRRGNNR